MLDSLGDIGDFVGGIGVVITLAYLAVQIRHSSKVAALAAGHTISIGITEFHERIALDPQLQSLWMRALDSPDTLDEAERDRFGRLIVGLFGRFLTAHRYGETRSADRSSIRRHGSPLSRPHRGRVVVG